MPPSNQFSFFVNGELIQGAIYGTDDDNQQNMGQTILTISEAPAVLTLRYFNNIPILPVALQSPAGGTQPNITASVFIQKLGEQTIATVTTDAELLAALHDETISTIQVEPGTYDLSGFPPIVRTTAVRLESVSPGAVIELNPDQEFDFITIGENVDIMANRIRNLNQGTDFPTIPAAIAAANPGDTIQLSPGQYTLDAPLIIDRSLTLRGISARLTEVEFDLSPIPPTGFLSIRASNVLIENLHWSGPTAASGDSSLYNVPLQAFPETLFENITLRHNIFEGGRRTAFINAENFSFIGNQVLLDSNRDALVFERSEGMTFVYGNRFSGGSLNRRVFSIEGDFARGTINISNNHSTRFTQYVLYNSIPTDLNLIVQENFVDHMDRSGSTVIFLPFGNFADMETILIDDNIFINPNPNRLAVYVDYRFGGTFVPADDQIQVRNNKFSIQLPWGSPTDTVDDDFPVGFSENAPAAMSLAVFDLQNNVNF